MCWHCLAVVVNDQVASELEKGNLKEPPAGWIRPGDAAEGAGGEESGSSGVGTTCNVELWGGKEAGGRSRGLRGVAAA